MLKPMGIRLSTPATGWAPKEDLNKTIDRILKLPTKFIRGFQLHYDSDAYYLIYPGLTYYIKRLWEPRGNGDKYRGPTGHKRPLFTVRYGSYAVPQKGPLLIVEGELNALSAGSALGTEGPIRLVVSPGAATNFCRPDFLEYYLQFDTIYIIVDKDAAGVLAGTSLRDKLLAANKTVVLRAVEKDFNEIYCEQGSGTVRTEIQKIMGVPDGV